MRTREEISYHETVEEAIRMISVYENADGTEGNYTPGNYDWKPIADPDNN